MSTAGQYSSAIFPVVRRTPERSVDDRPNGATDVRLNGATQRRGFSVSDGVIISRFWVLFNRRVFGLIIPAGGAITFPVKHQPVSGVTEPIERRGAEQFVGERLAPFGEVRVTSHAVHAYSGP
jgi:hypothetical protein